jgi:hypothetical protein
VIHTALIVVHAAAAVISFGLGCALMAKPPLSPRAPRLIAYVVSLGIAVAALSIVVAVDWQDLDPIRQTLFALLVALALVLLGRSVLALRAVRRQAGRWRRRFLAHIGFVLISLFDGFCIVFAIDLKLPPWAIAAAAVFGVVGGVVATRRAVRHAEAAEPGVPREAAT